MLVVFYLGTLREERSAQAILEELQAHPVPPGGILTLKHKFVLGTRAAPCDPSATELVLVVGPVFGDYYHRSIYKMFPDIEPAGGGFITFTGTRNEKAVAWHAVVDGSSGDYGVFNPSILLTENAQALVSALRMNVTLSYSRNHYK